MIRFFNVFYFCSLLGFCTAQKATEEAMQVGCNCFNSVQFQSVAYTQLQQVADSCMREALYTNMTGVLKENNIAFEKHASILKLARLFEQYLSDNCSGFQQYITRLAQKNVVEMRQQYPSTRGILYKIEEAGQFPVLYLIDETFQLNKFYWMQEFDGSTRFMNGIKDYKYWVVDLYWKEQEMYNHPQKKYVNYKEIVLIEEVEEIEQQAQKKWLASFEAQNK